MFVRRITKVCLHVYNDSILLRDDFLEVQNLAGVMTSRKTGN